MKVSYMRRLYTYSNYAAIAQSSLELLFINFIIQRLFPYGCKKIGLITFLSHHILIKICITQSNHPPQSQDWSFPKIKPTLERRRFATIEDIQKNVPQCVKAIQRNSKNALGNGSVTTISIQPTEVTQKEINNFYHKLWHIFKSKSLLFKKYLLGVLA